MSQLSSSQSKLQPDNYPERARVAALITRPMLLRACNDVEAELRQLLRRQRRMNLRKLLGRAISW